MTHRWILVITLSAAAGLAACSEEKSAPSAQQAEQPAPPGEGVAQPTMQDCDMEGMDMSKMSAEEHQKMMEECEKAKSQPEQN